MRIIIEIVNDMGQIKLNRQYIVENGQVQDLQDEIQSMVDTVVAEEVTGKLL